MKLVTEFFFFFGWGGHCIAGKEMRRVVVVVVGLALRVMRIGEQLSQRLYRHILLSKSNSRWV